MMDKKTLPILFIILSLLSLSLPTVVSTSPDLEQEPVWDWWTQPPYPEIGNCGDSVFSDITPPMDSLWVNITAKGVQICANITPPSGCNVTVQYEWFNYTHFFDDWLDWANAQPWGTWSTYLEWWTTIDWENETDPDNSTYWHAFTPSYVVTQSSQLCAFNSNVSCFIENDYTREYFDWRINYSINCSGSFTNGTCNYYFIPQKCSVIQYIYPPSPNGSVCPCCSEICITINNDNPMNITIYRNDSQFEEFYIINQLSYVTTGMHCFCIDGHINDTIYYPNNYNETYHWYVNATDTVTSEITISSIFQYRTPPNPSYCPCGPEEMSSFIISTYEPEDKIKDDTWILGPALLFSLFGILAYLGYHNQRPKNKKEIDERFK